jgi:hypothetical protein
MPLIDSRPLQKDDGSEWLSHRCLIHALDVPTLWDSRHVALEAEFANSAGAWISKKQNSYGWHTRQPETQKPSTYDSLFCDAKQYVEVEASVYAYPEIRTRSEGLRAEFGELAEQWRRDTRHLSQVSRKITHPAFLRIIGMGEAAIPLILEALRDKPAHWFTALRATANTDPSQPDDTPSQAREAWIAWGISKGYID